MRNQTRLSYITVTSIFVLTSIYTSVHTVGAKDSYTHSQLVISQQRFPKYSQLTIGRDRGKIHLVTNVLKDGTQERTKKTIDLFAVRVYPEVSSSISPRGPPNVI